MSATSSSPTVSVDPANTAQLAAWDGDEGEYWATHAATFDRSIAPHHRRLMAAAAIEPHERVLDIGCGTGETTRDAARAATAGSALGVDLSSLMLEYARRRAAEEGVRNAEFAQVDAQIHPFDPASFDVAISRTAVMFFGDLAAGLANVGRALRPDGRVALLTWQPRAANEWIGAISVALAAGREMSGPPPDTGPFSLSDPARVRALLATAGFTAIELDAVNEGMWFGADAEAATDFVIGLMHWMLDGLDETGRERARAGLRAAMDEHETADGVIFESGAWIIRASRL